ncbi:MAG: M48 family metalloprotease [Bacteroidales bacterium]|nr:M48 family metalloprotease [Bacteroidales bacterium]
MKKHTFALFLAGAIALAGCSKDKDLNFFSVKQDVQFGAQLDSTVIASPDEFPILKKSQYPQVYSYLQQMLDAILESEEILYKDEFVWKITVINSDVVNAFAAPGGYLYFYTGLIKYLDKGSELSGIMAHEVAHADRRHSTEAMTKQYGFSIVLSVLLGDNPTQMEQLLASLALTGTTLAYSRKNENEADQFAVYYSADTKYYHPLGIAGFFDKLINEGGGNGIPEFLSTHPSDENRIENINNTWNNLLSGRPELESVLWKDLVTEHTNIKATLP